MLEVKEILNNDTQVHFLRCANGELTTQIQEEKVEEAPLNKATSELLHNHPELSTLTTTVGRTYNRDIFIYGSLKDRIITNFGVPYQNINGKRVLASEVLNDIDTLVVATNNEFQEIYNLLVETLEDDYQVTLKPKSTEEQEAFSAIEILRGETKISLYQAPTITKGVSHDEELQAIKERLETTQTENGTISIGLSCSPDRSSAYIHNPNQVTFPYTTLSLRENGEQAKALNDIFNAVRQNNPIEPNPYTRFALQWAYRIFKSIKYKINLENHQEMVSLLKPLYEVITNPRKHLKSPEQVIQPESFDAKASQATAEILAQPSISDIHGKPHNSYLEPIIIPAIQYLFPRIAEIYSAAAFLDYPSSYLENKDKDIHKALERIHVFDTLSSNINKTGRYIPTINQYLALLIISAEISDYCTSDTIREMSTELSDESWGDYKWHDIGRVKGAPYFREPRKTEDFPHLDTTLDLDKIRQIVQQAREILKEKRKNFSTITQLRNIVQASTTPSIPIEEFVSGVALQKLIKLITEQNEKHPRS